jgi:MoaA/NifB/PqqE/SkfB family radical SAM enzyme
MSREHDWVEIALDYRCNLRCLGCRACEDNGERLGPAEVLQVLREARARDVPNLWIGGGEPTLRADLASIIATSRALGFSRVLLQTNGVRLAYAPFAAAVVRAGVTDVSLNVKSHRAEVHDRLSRVEGSHALLLAGLANLRTSPVRIAADILLTRATVPDLAATVTDFANRGVTRFTLWLLSAADSADPAVAAEVPSLTELADPIAEAAAAADRYGAELVSLHTPPCTLRRDHRDRYLPARSLRLVVVDPSGRSFPLENSPFEGGTFLEACGRCTSRSTCSGARSDYLSLHGPAGLNPI